MLTLARSYVIAVFILGIPLTGHGGEQSSFGRYTGSHSLGLLNLDRDTPVKLLLDSFGIRPAGKDLYLFCRQKKSPLPLHKTDG